MFKWLKLPSFYENPILILDRVRLKYMVLCCDKWVAKICSENILDIVFSFFFLKIVINRTIFFLNQRLPCFRDSKLDKSGSELNFEKSLWGNLQNTVTYRPGKCGVCRSHSSKNVVSEFIRKNTMRKSNLEFTVSCLNLERNIRSEQ